MEMEKTKNPKISIPEPLKTKVDKMVKTGLYSNEIEFVNDAVRRLIIQNKMEEKIKMSDKKKLMAKEHLMHEGEKHTLIKKPPP